MKAWLFFFAFFAGANAAYAITGAGTLWPGLHGLMAVLCVVMMIHVAKR